jgi:hypothetical protein
MAQVNFTYKGRSINILCNKNDIMRNIFQKFAIKANVNLDSIYFVYSGNYIDNQYLTFDQLSNNDDRIRNTMNILVNDYNKYYLMNSNQISSSPAQIIYQDKSNPVYQIYEAIPTFESQSAYQAMPTFQINSNYQTKNAYQSSPIVLKEESAYQGLEIPTFQTIQTEPKYQANPIFRINTAYQEMPTFQINQTKPIYRTNSAFQLSPTNQASPTFQTNPSFIIDSTFQANQAFQNNQKLINEPTKNVIPQPINYSNINQFGSEIHPENIIQNNVQAVNQVNNNEIRIQRPQVQVQPYGPIYQTLNELNFKIKMIEEKVKEKSKNMEKKVKDMQNRLKIVNKIKKRFPDGIYYGEFQNNNITGLGIFKGDNGEKYEGKWLYGIRNGI